MAGGGGGGGGGMCDAATLRRCREAGTRNWGREGSEQRGQPVTARFDQIEGLARALTLCRKGAVERGRCLNFAQAASG